MKNSNFRGYAMSAGGLYCTLHMPQALPQMFNDDGTEFTQGLPPYGAVPPYVVEEYKGCPKTWIRGNGKNSSYFLGVKPDHGMWLDFNDNQSHGHDVAIVVSIQGINPVTGLPTDGIFLEKYDERCPKHNVEFGTNRFCEECKFSWPTQNYLSTCGTPWGQLWLDGFRAEDGVIRQFIFTEKTMRGVAANIIGSDRVYSLGIGFFLSKNPKPAIQINQDMGRTTLSSHSMTYNYSPVVGGSMFSYTPPGVCTHTVLDSNEASILYESCNDLTLGVGGTSATIMNISPSNHSVTDASSLNEIMEQAAQQVTLISSKPSVIRSANVQRSVDHAPRTRNSSKTSKTEQKKLEVAAGAKVNQKVYPDPNPLDYWRDTPEGVIFINYTNLDELERILEGAKVDLTGGGEGFLQNLPVGDL